MRTDGLWRHTCFEAFVGAVASTEYWEFNFSPSGAWAAYHFSGYRAGMQPLRRGACRDFAVDMQDGALLLTAQARSRLAGARIGAALRLGLTAVIEDRAGQLSYWALKHPAEKPDFHHADSFLVRS